jgi:large subunit ribosomal protein L15
MSELTLHNLKVKKGAKKRPRRVGRGNASGRGTYSGRGLKGQRSRSGGKSGLKRRGLRQLLRNKPKIGGFKSLKPKMETVNLEQLEKNFEASEIVNAKKLIAKNLIGSVKKGVKILGSGKLNKKLTVIADSFSESAKKAIIKAGGKPEIRSKK